MSIQIRRAVGHRLKQIRSSLGLTQAQMARTLGIQSARYGKYEIGRSEAPYEVLIKIARLAEVSLDYLIAGETQERGRGSEEQLLELIHVIPLPAAIYDRSNRLVSHNPIYKQTFFPDSPYIVQPGTRQEVVLRAWAYAHGFDPEVTEEFVRQRLSQSPDQPSPVHVQIGSVCLQVAESWHADHKLVLASLVTPPPTDH